MPIVYDAHSVCVSCDCAAIASQELAIIILFFVVPFYVTISLVIVSSCCVLICSCSWPWRV